MLISDWKIVCRFYKQQKDLKKKNLREFYSHDRMLVDNNLSNKCLPQLMFVGSIVIEEEAYSIQPNMVQFDSDLWKIVEFLYDTLVSSTM